MPNPTSAAQIRLRFLQALDCPGATVTSVCAQFALSRPTFYKWRRRFREGGLAALADLSHAPRRCPQRLPPRWREALLALRRKHPHWGAKKLRHLLRQRHPRAQKLPALRTLERWLHQAQLTVAPAPGARPGPKLPRPPLTLATSPNQVWTIDFKGCFRLGDGHRCEPLTVRDLASRFLLAITPLPTTSDLCVRSALRPLFRRWGLPGVIRVDNGTPFGSLQSPLGLSSLSVWWRRLGIRVEFIRPAKPQDNGAHEQMHRLLKAETLSPPALNLRAQLRSFRRWQHTYNHLRPHQALGGRPPAQLYRPSARPWQPPLPLRYPTGWLTRCVLRQGTIKFDGRVRHIGRAFAGQTIGLKPASPEHFEVYLGGLHLGLLYLHDPGAMRPCTFQNTPRAKAPKSTVKPARRASTVNHPGAVKCKASPGGRL